MQGFVRENPIADDKSEKAIRRFIIGPQIFQTIKSALMDPELEELPTDYERGLDFRVSKTQKGGYADYSTSKWARKETALTEVQRAAIETHGLHTLSDYLPKRPTEVEINVLKEMFEASVDGEAYDADRWSQYFRPAGMQARTGDPQMAASPNATATSQSAPAPQPAATPVAETVNDTGWQDPTPAPAAEAAPAEDNAGGAQDILAMIRARQGQ